MKINGLDRLLKESAKDYKMDLSDFLEYIAMSGNDLCFITALHDIYRISGQIFSTSIMLPKVNNLICNQCMVFYTLIISEEENENDIIVCPSNWIL